MGDCRGRAWCGTCHIEILEGHLGQAMEPEEAHRLPKQYNRTARSPLARQIPLKAGLVQIVFGTMEPS